MDSPVKTPPGPRNLAVPVAQLLRELGFTVWEQLSASPSVSLVSGWWQGGPGGERFCFQYAHHHGPQAPAWWGGCSLAVQPASALTPPLDCFSMTQVRRLREVRLLLLGNERFAQARAALSASHPATPQPHASL